MGRSIRNDRERERSDDASPGDEIFVASLGQAGVLASLGDRIEGEPFGGGTEAETSSGSMTLLDEWTIPIQRQGELDEIAAEAASNGEVVVSVDGIMFGPYSGKTSVTIPFDGAILVEDRSVRVFHRSTDGATTTSKAQLTGRLY
jgi:hypothetical protein